MGTTDEGESLSNEIRKPVNKDENNLGIANDYEDEMSANEPADILHSFEMIEDDQRDDLITTNQLKDGYVEGGISEKLVKKGKSRRKKYVRKSLGNKTWNGGRNLFKEMKKLKDRMEILEGQGCSCDYDENENSYRIEDLELLVNDNNERSKGDIEILQRSSETVEKELKEHKNNMQNVQYDVYQIFDNTNEYEKELKEVQSKISLVPKIIDEKFDSNNRNIEVFKRITEETLNLLDEKSKDDFENTLAQSQEILALRKALVNMLFIISNQIQCMDENVCSVANQLNKRMYDLSKESIEFEKIFYNNFSSLTHGLNQKSSSPGQLLYQQKGFKKGQIKLTFDKVTIPLPYTSAEICARILTVHGKTESQGFFKKMMSNGTDVEEKVVLLVGVTGAGKSTLIDAITNFYYNVRYDDTFRLALIDLLDAEKKKQANQASSQTDEITVYKLPYLKNGNAKGFKLTIIDTPGVADTRGINQDKKIIEKLRYLFEDGRISFLNSVCFVSNAGNSRLTAGQKYIFDSLITNFGVDLVNNIIGLFTFDDGGPAKATDAFKEAKIGLTAHFKFNSQAMLHQRIYETPVNKTIMMTMEAQDCVQFQHFYNNCDEFFGTLIR